MSLGLAWPSVGRNAAPITSSTFISGQSSWASLGESNACRARTSARWWPGASPPSSVPRCRRAAVRRCASSPWRAPSRLEPIVEATEYPSSWVTLAFGPQLPDKAGRMPGRARTRACALEQQNVRPAPPAEVVGHRTADDAAADDDHLGGGRKIFHARSMASKAAKRASKRDRFSPCRRGSRNRCRMDLGDHAPQGLAQQRGGGHGGKRSRSSSVTGRSK
jgi:hypothetical protein